MSGQTSKKGMTKVTNSNKESIIEGFDGNCIKWIDFGLQIG
jgi:hypothetical protein